MEDGEETPKSLAEFFKVEKVFKVEKGPKEKKNAKLQTSKAKIPNYLEDRR